MDGLGCDPRYVSTQCRHVRRKKVVAVYVVWIAGVGVGVTGWSMARLTMMKKEIAIRHEQHPRRPLVDTFSQR